MVDTISFILQFNNSRQLLASSQSVSELMLALSNFIVEESFLIVDLKSIMLCCWLAILKIIGLSRIHGDLLMEKLDTLDSKWEIPVEYLIWQSMLLNDET